jgi:CBS domain-containing protein
MTEHRLTAVPVLDDSRQLLGMVSEVDVIRKQERRPSMSALASIRRRQEQRRGKPGR